MPGKDLSLARTSVSALRAALFAVIAMLAVTQLSAQSTSTYTEYAAKFLCGVPTSAILAKGGIENAEYSTSINIHNPNHLHHRCSALFPQESGLRSRRGHRVHPSLCLQAGLAAK